MKVREEVRFIQLLETQRGVSIPESSEQFGNTKTELVVYYLDDIL